MAGYSCKLDIDPNVSAIYATNAVAAVIEGVAILEFGRIEPDVLLPVLVAHESPPQPLHAKHVGRVVMSLSALAHLAQALDGLVKQLGTVQAPPAQSAGTPKN